jgi:hypothetical protein
MRERERERERDGEGEQDTYIITKRRSEKSILFLVTKRK